MSSPETRNKAASSPMSPACLCGHQTQHNSRPLSLPSLSSKYSEHSDDFISFLRSVLIVLEELGRSDISGKFFVSGTFSGDASRVTACGSKGSLMERQLQA
ncbi:hypothetical protein Nepgr_028286 [Nepenthes gracilis]|uniref:Uncharacterized protein n=1 Tax=Nepenthes gracilis TaxID=150966 RepID=A0AAD3Y298_NEPGR|nr:hypothetical protein Nepgr_028286 [Nepenthes gracilis]